MNGTTFDTLRYFEKLKEAGFTEAQAKVQTEVIKSFVESSEQGLATKRDIQEVRLEMQAVKFDLLKWMIGLAFAQMALVTGLLAFLK